MKSSIRVSARSILVLLSLLAPCYSSSPPQPPPSPELAILTHYDLDPNSLKTAGPPRYVPRSSTSPPPSHLSHLRDRAASTPGSNGTISLIFTCNISGAVSRLTPDWDPQDLPSTTDNVCTKANAMFLRAIERIAKVVYLRERVVVTATFASFCATEKDVAACRADQDTLGSAGPAAWHEWNATYAETLGVDDAYLYPSALARQYAPDALSEQTVDVSANFNSEPLWWFATVEDPVGDRSDEFVASQLWDEQWGGLPDQPVRMRGSVYDFEAIVLHELMHGMGFICSWYPWLDATSVIPASPLVTADGTMVGMTKPWLFNKWMADVSAGVWMKEYQDYILTVSASIAQGISNGTLVDTTFLAEFLSSPGYAIAQKVFSGPATTPGSVAFYYPRASDTLNSTADPLRLHYAVLYTPELYSDGSTFSHVDNQIYSGTQQFLMRAYGTAGIGLGAMRPVGQPIGEVVQGVLGALGYSTSLFKVRT
ncbi:hypothetical protein HKX48_001048 [Thoreauomyces humboldtii]|nr:hypothetical protein HKX48_001048 [Thoreauomyces humboldtii]